MILRDWLAKKDYTLPDDTRCEACNARHRPKKGRSYRLVLDHTWWPDGTYFLTVLCSACNNQKIDMPYVSRGDECWWPGMPPNTTVPKPPGSKIALAASWRAGRVQLGRGL